jgi:hypothetical protein
MIGLYRDPNLKTECERHRGFAPVSSRSSYKVTRCAHIGQRFVVQIEPVDGHYFTTVDYVEDLSDGDVVVEAYSPQREDVDAVWDDLVAKMRADVPPDPSLVN